MNRTESEESLLLAQDDNASRSKNYKICKFTALFVGIITLLFVSCLTDYIVNHHNDENPDAQKYDHYDYYVYAQQWPASLCKSINETHHGTCNKVPKIVNTWAVHGLWPSRAHTKHYGPFNCNTSWPFDFNQIKPFINEMEEFWPNLMQNKEDDSFWEHEWTKHGTCACQIGDETDGFGCKREADYFKKALEVQKDLDFTNKIKNNPKIKISSEISDTAPFSEIEKTLGSGRYQCYQPEKGVYQVLAQVMVCLDKKFNRVKCEDYESPFYNKKVLGDYDTGPYNPGTCSHKLPVMIYPIHMPMGN